MAVDPAGADLRRSLITDQPTAFGVVILGKQATEWDVGELGIAIEGIPVGEGELGAFLNGVYELGTTRIHAGDVIPLQQRQLLQQNGTLRPWARLANAIPAVVDRDRCLHGRPPSGKILTSQEAGVRLAGRIHDRLPEEPVDRFGDEAFVPGTPRSF